MTEKKHGRKKKCGRKKTLPGEWKEFYTTMAVGRDTKTRLEKLMRAENNAVNEIIWDLLDLYDELLVSVPDWKGKSPSELFQYLIDMRHTEEHEKKKKQETNGR